MLFACCCLLAPSHTCLVLCVLRADSRVGPTVIYFHPASRSPGAAEHHSSHNAAATKTSKRPVVLWMLTQKGSYIIFNLYSHGFAWLYWKTVSAMSPSFGEESNYTNKYMSSHDVISSEMLWLLWLLPLSLHLYYTEYWCTQKKFLILFQVNMDQRDMTGICSQTTTFHHNSHIQWPVPRTPSSGTEVL